MNAVEDAVSYVARTPQGGWRISGTRVGLECIIHAYNEGESPEAMVLSWPTLSLEQIHGAIAFYLRNRPQMDEYMREIARQMDELSAQCQESNRGFREKILARYRAQQAHQPPVAEPRS